ncbi:MAG: hypothetical protein EOM92_14065 [Gammaproteobacteria bacterium]|nr:hypothetical protein [Gammaproteobacteria bacterium]
MRSLLVIFAILSALVVTGCATEYKVYEGRNNVIEGKGGTKIVVDGMEIWDNGDPPRTYQVLGVIEDSRSGGLIAQAMHNGDMVSKARAYGGEALIKLSADSEITGYITSSSGSANVYGNNISGYGTTLTMPARRNYTKYAVIKYVK